MMYEAVFPTALIASAENRNTSIAPSSDPMNTSIFARLTTSNFVAIPSFAVSSVPTSSMYAENSRNAANAADPIAYPLVSAFVVLPTASSLSVLCLTSFAALLISAMPPALSVIGPNVSIARMYAAVDNIPIVAIAVPYRPPPANPVLARNSTISTGLLISPLLAVRCTRVRLRIRR